MSNPFAVGRKALGACDRCGQVFKLSELVVEYEKRRPTGLLVCKSCDDEDHPQLYLGETPVNDPQALRNPRPIIGLAAERSFWSWAPIFVSDKYVPTCRAGEVEFE